MRIHGYCSDCHKPKLVNARLVRGKGIPVGQCDECAQKVVDRRSEAGELAIYVPRDERKVGIAPGSAIVGRDRPTPGTVEVYYEGDVYGSMGKDYNRMLMHAADRLVARYPTVARSWLPEDELIRVGTYDYGTKTASIDDPIALQAWRAA